MSVGSVDFQAIVDGATALKVTFESAEAQIRVGFIAYEKIVATQIPSWKAKEAVAQKKVDEKRHELETLKIPFDMSYIAKLTKDEANHRQSLNNLNTWKPHLAGLHKKRAETLKERWAARDRVAELRDTFARQATTILREALTDLQMSLKYDQSTYSPDGASLIIEIMGWRTNQQPRAMRLVEEMTIPVLLKKIQTKNEKSFS